VKILVIVERLPSRIGGGIRQWGLIRELSCRHEFSVVSYAYPVDAQRMDDLRPFVQRLETVSLPQPVMPQRSAWYWRANAWTHTLLDSSPRRGRYPESAAFRARVREVIEGQRFDIIQVHQAYMARFLPETDAATLLDMQDILSAYEQLVYQKKAKWTERFAAWAEWKKTLALERRTIPGFDLCTTATEEDRTRVLRVCPEARVSVIPNGVDTRYFRPSTEPPSSPSLVFVGSMDYAANVDAVLHFYHAILPLVRAREPGIRFYVVGYGPPPEVLALKNDPSVVVTGLVSDVRPYLAQAAVVVVPLRLGSGIRNKILEAWASSKAIVSTNLGAEGLPVRHGENILLADEPEEFAECVLDLLGSPRKCMQLGEAGRAMVEASYSWPIMAAKMDAIYDELAL